MIMSVAQPTANNCLFASKNIEKMGTPREMLLAVVPWSFTVITIYGVLPLRLDGRFRVIHPS